MKKIVKYLVGIIAIALIYLLISNFNLIMFKIAIYQQEIVEKISELIEKENEKIIYTMLFFTFLYGIVHSFGPGHGKTLVLTYSVKEKLNFPKLLLVSFLIAYLQGLSAYILVKFIINLSDKASMMLFYDLDNRTRLIASILIILIGLYNIYSILRNKSCEHCHETKVKNTFSANTTERILRTLISISMPENQPDDQPAKRPELPLTLLEMAFSYAALSGKTALSCEYIEQAVHHSNRLRKEIRTNFTCAL